MIRLGPGGGLICVSSQVCLQFRNVFLQGSEGSRCRGTFSTSAKFRKLLSVFARGLSAENADRTFHSVSERRECFEVFSPDGRGASGDTF